jgi:callose synthase
MSREIYEILDDNLHPVTGASYLAAAVDEESFLKEVITPIYKVLLKVIMILYRLH